MNALMMKILTAALPLIVSNLTPVFRQELINLVNKLDEIAKKSANPFDDIAVNILKHILVIPEGK